MIGVGFFLQNESLDAVSFRGSADSARPKPFPSFRCPRHLVGLWFSCLWVTRRLPKLPQSRFHTTASKDGKRKLPSRVSLYQAGSSVFPAVVRGSQLWSGRGGRAGRQWALFPVAISATTSMW